MVGVRGEASVGENQRVYVDGHWPEYTSRFSGFLTGPSRAVGRHRSAGPLARKAPGADAAGPQNDVSILVAPRAYRSRAIITSVDLMIASAA